jgi:hypothetical protein
MGQREFRARNLTPSEWGRVDQARKDVLFALGFDPTDKELLLLLVNDTAPSWRKWNGRNQG